MARSVTSYKPTSVSPPGATIADLLDERGMTQSELARRMGRPEKTISELVHGKAAITPETALQLESVFDVPARFWVTREANYREFLARSAQDRALRKDHPWARLFPLREMGKRGWIEQRRDPEDQVREVLGYFSVASRAQWTECTRDFQAAYRSHRAFTPDEYALTAWLQAGRLSCERRRLNEFDEARFRDALASVRAWTRLDPDEGLRRASEALAAAGVALAIVPELPRCRVSGATMWVGAQRAVLQLSLRYRTDDHLWFTFFHEAAHLLLHPRKGVFLEVGGDAVDEVREVEADCWARDYLIAPREWQVFVEQGDFGLDAIGGLAERLSIAPGLVVGRLQHEGRIGFAARNRLKRKLDPAKLAAAAG